MAVSFRQFYNWSSGTVVAVCLQFFCCSLSIFLGEDLLHFEFVIIECQLKTHFFPEWAGLQRENVKIAREEKQLSVNVRVRGPVSGRPSRA